LNSRYFPAVDEGCQVPPDNLYASHPADLLWEKDARMAVQWHFSLIAQTSGL